MRIPKASQNEVFPRKYFNLSNFGTSELGNLGFLGSFVASDDLGLEFPSRELNSEQRNSGSTLEVEAEAEEGYLSLLAWARSMSLGIPRWTKNH